MSLQFVTNAGSRSGRPSRPCPPCSPAPSPGYLRLVAVAIAAAAADQLAIAIGTVDRLIATRYKRNLGVFATVGADHLGHGALGTAIAVVAASASASTVAVAVAVAACACGLLGCAARRAAHWLAVALLRVEILLTLGKSEASTAIAARKC